MLNIIYNLDHGIKFERCPRSLFYEYNYKEKNKKYYPDFILPDNSLVEIKGYKTEQDSFKWSSVQDRKLIILMEKDLKYAFDYVKENYSYEKLEDLYEKKKK